MANNAINPDDLMTDDGMPSMAKKATSSINLRFKLILAGVAVLLIIIIVMFSSSDEPPPAPIAGSGETSSFTIKNELGDAPKIPGKPTGELASKIEYIEKAKTGTTSIDTAFEAKNNEAIRYHQKKSVALEEIRTRKKQKGLLHYSGDTGTVDGQPDSKLIETAKALAGPEGTGLTQALTPTIHASTKAGTLPDRDLFITKGTFLDCALETAINSTLSGMVSCRLTTNVYSTSGRVLLLERGSRITGEYMGGLKNGQARIFALWTRVETPNGVLIDINSPGADALGRTGHDGYVETYFWKKFGAAILLSFIDDMSMAASSQLSRSVYYASGGTTVIPPGEAQSYSELPSAALEATIDIPPVLTKNQGEHISIFVARDLDFRTVYELRSNQ